MLLEMLTYRRPEGTLTQEQFCEKFIEPLMGYPDAYGNYHCEVGEGNKIAFMCHHDTMHRSDGIQKVEVDDTGMVYTVDPMSSCLGADCTTGVYLILEMIKAKVPGYYIIHAAEEIGLVGAEAFVKENPELLKRIDVALSFDRFGTTSIITHQGGLRTASDAFSESLSGILGGDFKSDRNGSCTDSLSYVNHVAECSNLSVGYYNQHTKKEVQSLAFAESLKDKLIAADWSKLVVERNPSVVEYDDDGWYGFPRNWYAGDDSGYDDPIADLCQKYPEDMAEIFRSYGFTYNDILDEMGMQGKFVA